MFQLCVHFYFCLGETVAKNFIQSADLEKWADQANL